MADTVLVLEGMGIPSWSARGIQESFGLIDGASQLERSCNGNLIDFGAEQFRKYTLQLSCSDQRAPRLNGMWPGTELTVTPVTEFIRPTGDAAEREVLPGSERVEGDFTVYRVRLTMWVKDFTVQTDEYGAAVSWELNLEETGGDETA